MKVVGDVTVSLSVRESPPLPKMGLGESLTLSMPKARSMKG